VRSLTLQNVWLVIASIFPYVKFFRRRPQDRSSFISVFTVRLDLRTDRQLSWCIHCTNALTSIDPSSKIYCHSRAKDHGGFLPRPRRRDHSFDDRPDIRAAAMTVLLDRTSRLFAQLSLRLPRRDIGLEFSQPFFPSGMGESSKIEPTRTVNCLRQCPHFFRP
jgi:hypothetical protein